MQPGANPRNLKAVLSKAAFLHPQTSSSSIWRQHVTVVAALDSALFVHGSRWWNYSTDLHSPMISSNSAAPGVRDLAAKVSIGRYGYASVAELISSSSSAEAALIHPRCE
jgi:hypothetical protein